MNSANLKLRTGACIAMLCLLAACDTPPGYGSGYDNGYGQQPAYRQPPPDYGAPPVYGAPPRYYPPQQPDYRPPPPGYDQRPPSYGVPAPNYGPTAPAIANQNCIRAAADTFKKPWQTIVLGGSQRLQDGNYAVQLTSGTDGRRVVCVSSGMGNVLGLR